MCPETLYSLIFDPKTPPFCTFLEAGGLNSKTKEIRADSFAGATLETGYKPFYKRFLGKKGLLGV